MHDAVGRPGREGHRVAAADQQVAGVEAERDRRAVEHPARRPRRSPPWCRRAGAGRPGPRGRRHGRPAGPGCPAAASSRPRRARAARRSRRCRSPRPARGHPHRRPGSRRAPGRPRAAGRARPRAGRPGRSRRQRPTVLGQGRRLGRRIVGQEAVRSELGGPQPHLAHLGEHPPGVELVAPAGHLADPPRDGGPGDPVEQRGHRRTSSRSTGRCWARDSSQASAT